MQKFIVELAIFLAITTLATVPHAKVAKYVERPHNTRKWMKWAFLVALLTAGLGWSSRDLQAGCKQERNEGCVDAGGAGSQMLFLGCFVMFALTSAYMLYND
jgi:hypothetical protein